MGSAMTDDGPAADGALPSPIRVFIVDDHPMIVWGITQMLDAQPARMRVIGSSTSAEGLLEHPALPECDVLLLDLEFKDANGLDILPLLVARLNLKVLILTGSRDPSQHREAVRRGAQGVVLKLQPLHQMIEAIERVHAGGMWLSPELMRRLIVDTRAPAQDPEVAARIASLTPKERQVIEALVQLRGARNADLAGELGINEHTLRNHLSVIYSKLGLRGKLELYVFAMEQGIAPPR